ncbi:MAG: ABC transporter substrate-binding protein [Polyangiaceae bacterium]|jgi:sulfonate transport system substrate-binding protein
MAAVSPSPSSRTSAFARLGLGLLVVALAGACSRKSADPQASAAGSSAKENSPGLASYGKPGEPIHLVVGYQPYYSEAWSGVVLNGRALWKKYLPAGSTVEFNIGLQGSILINAMLAGKQQIGYVGDMPAIVGATKREVADIRIVAHIGLSRDQCNVFFTRNDAPTFSDPKAALQWLDGKTVAVPKGSCTDRFARAVFAKQKITPAAYLNQSIELITSGFRVNKLDAAVVWEPTASRLVAEGLARRVATGNDVDEADGAFIDARADLIEQRPDVISGWLRAELDAEIFLADPKNSRDVARMAKEQTTGFEEREMWQSLFGTYAESAGGSSVRMTIPFGFTPQSLALLQAATAFLYEVKSIGIPELPKDAIVSHFTDEILRERGFVKPVAEIRAAPQTAFR